jgi:hypothetical protein
MDSDVQDRCRIISSHNSHLCVVYVLFRGNNPLHVASRGHAAPPWTKNRATLPSFVGLILYAQCKTRAIPGKQLESQKAQVNL